VPEDDELARIVRRLAIEHAETRWLALRLDDDVKEIRGELRAVRAVQREHTDTLQEHTGILQEHTGRFDSVDAQLRSLTQLVGQVLERLPDEPAEHAARYAAHPAGNGCPGQSASTVAMASRSAAVTHSA
jgi:hypothetical protein